MMEEVSTNQTCLEETCNIYVTYSDACSAQANISINNKNRAKQKAKIKIKCTDNAGILASNYWWMYLLDLYPPYDWAPSIFVYNRYRNQVLEQLFYAVLV